MGKGQKRKKWCQICFIFLLSITLLSWTKNEQYNWSFLPFSTWSCHPWHQYSWQKPLFSLSWAILRHMTADVEFNYPQVTLNSKEDEIKGVSIYSCFWSYFSMSPSSTKSLLYLSTFHMQRKWGPQDDWESSSFSGFIILRHMKDYNM